VVTPVDAFPLLRRIHRRGTGISSKIPQKLLTEDALSTTDLLNWRSKHFCIWKQKHAPKQIRKSVHHKLHSQTLHNKNPSPVFGLESRISFVKKHVPSGETMAVFTKYVKQTQKEGRWFSFPSSQKQATSLFIHADARPNIFVSRQSIWELKKYSSKKSPQWDDKKWTKTTALLPWSPKNTPLHEYYSRSWHTPSCLSNEA